MIIVTASRQPLSAYTRIGLLDPPIHGTPHTCRICAAGRWICRTQENSHGAQFISTQHVERLQADRSEEAARYSGCDENAITFIHTVVISTQHAELLNRVKSEELGVASPEETASSIETCATWLRTRSPCGLVHLEPKQIPPTGGSGPDRSCRARHPGYSAWASAAACAVCKEGTLPGPGYSFPYFEWATNIWDSLVH